MANVDGSGWREIPNFWCSICGNKFPIIDQDLFIIKNVPDSTFNLADKTVDLKLIECKHCGAVSQYDYTLSEDYDAVYRSIGISSSYRDYKKEQLANFISKYKLVGKDLIEVGCGDGQFLEIFRELGVDCFGIETSIKNYTKCCEKGIECGVGNVCDNIPKKSYDALFTFHYLEHLPSPVEFVKNLYRVLRPNGIGLIEVPNYDYIEKHDIWLEFTKDHIYYYRKRTLSHLVLKCGFEIESLEETNGGVCLTMVVRKPKESNFDSMKKSMTEELKNFKELTQSLVGNFAVYGCGHYSQMLLHNLYENKEKMPIKIFDSNKTKCGNKLCGIIVEHRENIFNYKNFDTIIIICGIYNKEVFDSLSYIIKDKNILTFGKI